MGTRSKNMALTGLVNKGACRMLLAKCYLAIGEYAKAKEQTDILINQSGYSLMPKHLWNIQRWWRTTNMANYPKCDLGPAPAGK